MSSDKETIRAGVALCGIDAFTLLVKAQINFDSAGLTLTRFKVVNVAEGALDERCGVTVAVAERSRGGEHEAGPAETEEEAENGGGLHFAFCGKWWLLAGLSWICP